MAELEVLHLNEFFKQVTQKHTEDMKRLEEKVVKVFIFFYHFYFLNDLVYPT